MNGASTNPEFDILARAGGQVKLAIDTTIALGGENYVFWGGREGYMSLLNTASPWKGCNTQKRTPSIGKRRTQRSQQPLPEESASSLAADLEEQEDISDQLKMTMETNDERSTAVNDMLNRITADPIDSGNGLADFRPVAPGPAKSKSFMDNLADLLPKEGFESDTLRRAAAATAAQPKDITLDSLSSYTKSYESGGILGKPYYSQSAKTGEASDGVMQKLNYITHMLEDIQMEKTSNITEELILYTFLGVFTIFIVDSFARVGKYHR
jgi:hypothetical protein